MKRLQTLLSSKTHENQNQLLLLSYIFTNPITEVATYDKDNVSLVSFHKLTLTRDEPCGCHASTHDIL